MSGNVEAERALFAEIMPRVERIQDAVAAKQRSTVKRAFHNKGTVVSIRFDVAPALPEVLRVGFLRPGASYPGFGRFSRSQSFHRRDGDRDQRGFAFRLETDDGAQDVLLSNTPASFARDLVQFLTVTTLFAEHALPIAAVRSCPQSGSARASGSCATCSVHPTGPLPSPPSATGAGLRSRSAMLPPGCSPGRRLTSGGSRPRTTRTSSRRTSPRSSDRAHDHLSCAPSCSSTRRGRRSRTRARSGTRASPRRS